jgi:hypothetical protein
MPVSPKVPAIGDEANFPPLPPASPSPAPAELSAEAKLIQQLADQQTASEKRIQLMLEQHQLAQAATLEQHQVLQAATESRITQLEKINAKLQEHIDSPTEEDISSDAGNFLNCNDYKDRIAAGLDVFPPVTSSVRPQLFDLHQDKTFAAITSSGKHKAALEEYKILYCMLFFLSCANQAFKEFILEQVPLDQQVLLAPLLNTYSLIEEWNRKRLAFIRANHILDGDAAFVEYLRGKIYEEANASSLGSKELAAIAAQYTAAKGKANLYQAAKTSASRTFGKAKTDTSGANSKPEKLRFKEKPGSYSKGAGPSGAKKDS